jgi:hypothetical protein
MEYCYGKGGRHYRICDIISTKTREIMCNNRNNTGEVIILLKIWRKCQLGYTNETKTAAVVAVRMTGCLAQKHEVK